MNKSDEEFINEYEKLLDKGYCNCNEMNCLDNDTPRKILNIAKGTKLEAKQLLEENQQLKEQLNNPLRGIFAQVNDDDLLRSSSMYYAENQQLKEQLQQRDETIDKAIEFVEKQQVSEKNLYTANVILDLCCDLKEILKGDNNE